MKAKLFAMALALTTLLGAQHAEGCSRVLYVGSDSLRIVHLTGKHLSPQTYMSIRAA